jgi:hypothetical protein
MFLRISCCEEGNEHPDSIKFSEFLDRLMLKCSEES